MENKEDNIDIELINYSDKCMVLRGKKTKDWSNRLKEEGGRFNASLTDPKTSKKFCGWVFKKTDNDKINKILYDMNNVHTEKAILPTELNMEIILEDIPIPIESKLQKINFEIQVPYIGMTAKIFVNNNIKYTGKIIKVSKTNDIVIECIVKVNQKEGLTNTIMCGIIGMKWKVLGTLIDTEVVFD